MSKSKSRKSRTRSRTSKNSETIDYVAIAIAYAEEAIEDEGHQTYCIKVQQAARRFLSDLERSLGDNPPFNFSARQANRYCAFIEQLPHVEGKWETPNIRLHPAHVFFVVNLFGFRQENGRRRFTSALLAVARKNAKSTLAAAIMLACFCLEAENGPQVISAATTGQQARIIFNCAKRMVEKMGDMREAFELEPFAHSIIRYENAGRFWPINAKASTQDGLNPSHCSLDEIHAHKTHDLLNVLRSAAGARAAPLFLFTTTEGYDNPGPWAETRSFATNILNGTVVAEHFLVLFFELDEDDDDFDPAKWVKANPLMTVNPALMNAIEKEAIEAKAMPGARGEFRIKRLNRRSSAAGAFVNLQKWDRCDGAVDIKMLLERRARCWASFDLASTTDMNAWRMLWELDGMYYTRGRFWVPEDAVKQRTERNVTTYQPWIAAGLVRVTQGDVADYEQIQQEILEDIERFAPRVIGYDPWNASSVVNWLVKEGVHAATAEDPRGLQAFIQGTHSYNAAMKAFEVAYTSGNLCHGGNRVLRWNAANLVARTDVNMNLAPDRKKSTEKIDGVVCLIMDFGVAQADIEKPPPRIRSL